MSIPLGNLDTRGVYGPVMATEMSTKISAAVSSKLQKRAFAIETGALSRLSNRELELKQLYF